jgi:hypothetical protein
MDCFTSLVAAAFGVTGFSPWVQDEVMVESHFVYVTYLRTTLERLWQALTDAEFTCR